MNFAEALRLAQDGDTRPLADYVESSTPLTASQRWQLARLLRAMRRRARGERGPQRTPRPEQAAAVYRLARQIAERMRLYCHRNHRSKVPRSTVIEMIKSDIRLGTWPATWQTDHRRDEVIEQVLQLLKNPARLRERERPRLLPEVSERLRRELGTA